MANQFKLGKHATAVRGRCDRLGDTLQVQYHSTVVVQVDNTTQGMIVNLDTGGWLTQTTKTRMNQTAGEYNLPFSVYQKAHRWVVAIGRNGGAQVKAEFERSVRFNLDTREVLDVR